MEHMKEKALIFIEITSLIMQMEDWSWTKSNFSLRKSRKFNQWNISSMVKRFKRKQPIFLSILSEIASAGKCKFITSVRTHWIRDNSQKSLKVTLLHFTGIWQKVWGTNRFWLRIQNHVYLTLCKSNQVTSCSIFGLMNLKIKTKITKNVLFEQIKSSLVE